MIISSMTATAAIQHMSHTLTGLIKQSQLPGFIEAEACADIKTSYDFVVTSCTDLATIIWLREHLCFGYVGDECTFKEINLGYRITLASSSCQAGVQARHRRTG